MAARPPSIPTPRQTSPLRVLAGIACVAVTVAAILVSVVAWQAIATNKDLDRVVGKADRVADDAARSVRDLNRTTEDLAPAIRSLRDAARSLRETQSAGPP